MTLAPPEDEPSGDWLDEALTSRDAMRAPAGFTETVLARVAMPAAALRPPSTAWIEEAGRAGLLFAALGAASTVDVRGFLEWLNRGLQAPAPVTFAALALVVSGIWLTWKTDVLD